MQSRAILMIEHRLIERVLALMDTTLSHIESERKIDPLFIDIIADFIQNYADKNHHGKEEDILFQFLKEKEMTAEDNLLMNELMEEHVHGREATHNLSDSCRSYRSGDVSALNNIVDNLRILNKLYPEHINKEDNIFFPATMKYLSEKDDYHLLTRYYEFDKKMIHEKYVSVIDACERQLSLV
jgi:hemerythrin-like domain-containing protein